MGELFSFFWHGRPLPILHWAGLSSFVQRGHQVKLYTYDPMEVPAGVCIEDADSIIPRRELFHFHNPTTDSADLGPFSDLFRFKLLLLQGGWWSDTDVVCLRFELPRCSHAWAAHQPEVDPAALSPSQIKFPRGDPLIRELYSNCLESCKSIRSREQVGPRLFTQTLSGRPRPDGHWGSTQEFYPIRWIETFKLWLPEYREEVDRRLRPAFFLSTYNSMHDYMNMAVKMPVAGSWLEAFYRAAAPERMTSDHYTREETLSRVHRFLHLNSHYAADELERISGPGILDRLGYRPGDWPAPTVVDYTRAVT